jgi:hypothetical protein
MPNQTNQQHSKYVPAQRSIYIGVFLVSVATLLLEINLTRIFSFTIWYHFAFIVIAVALLGFGASGSVLTVYRNTSGHSPQTLLTFSALIAALSVVFAGLVVTVVPLDPFQMMTDRVEIVYMALYLISVTVPFFFAGFIIAISFKSYSKQVGALYFSDLIGSALGCFVFVQLIKMIGPPNILGLSAVLYCAAAACFTTRHTVASFSGIAAMAVVLQVSSLLFNFTPCASKLGTRYVKNGATIADSRWTAVFRTDLYNFGDKLLLNANPSLTIYGTPFGGVGKQFSGDFPSFRFITHDGDASPIMVHSAGSPDNMALYRHHILGVSYRLRPHASVFIGGVGGGIDIQAALTNGAKTITGVELDPETVAMTCDRYAGYVGNLCVRENVTVRAGDARSVIRRSSERFDIINFTSVDTISSTATGAYLLNEGYLYTVEAFNDYFDHLKPGGFVSIVSGDMGGLLGTARAIPRFASVAVSALERRHIANPQKCIVILGTSLPEGDVISHEVVLVKTVPFTAAELNQISDIAQTEGFVFWHFPGKEIDTAASNIIRLSPKQRETYLERFYLDYSAVTDNKPFFMHFYKWRSLTSHLKIDQRYVEATGNVVLLVSLAFSVIASLLFILLPIWIDTRRQTAVPRIRFADISYFSAIGLGFMFLEVSMIQQLSLFLGYPTYSLTVTLFSMLTFAGLGSLLSRKIPVDTARYLWMIFAVLTGTTLIYFCFGENLLRDLLYLSLPYRIAIVILALCPIGLTLGAFLPMAIRDLGERSPEAIPLAWAANGSCSVIGTVLSVILATIIGFWNVCILAIILYFVATSSFHLTRIRHVTGHRDP